MDKLAQRAGVSALVLIASAGAALVFGMYRMALSLDPAPLSAAPATAMLKLPEVTVAPAAPAPVALVAAPAPAPAPAPAAPPSKPEPAQATDLASAFGAALGAHPKPKTPAAAPAAEADTTPRGADDLDLGFKSPARDTSFNERGARAFAVRQTGGAEPARKVDKSPGERLSFETDLGSPDSR